MTFETGSQALSVKQGETAIIGEVVVSEDKTRASFVTQTGLPDGQLEISISKDATDIHGNSMAEAFTKTVNYNGSDTVVDDSVAPEVQQIIYKETGEFEVQFSEIVSHDTVGTSLIFEKDGGRLSAEISVMDQNGSTTATVRPGQPVILGQEYALWVKGTLGDQSGNHINEFFHQFVVMQSDLLVYERPDPTLKKESRIGNTHLFHGRTFEPEVGLYYYRNRYFLPRLGRFLQPTPLGNTDSMNSYQAFNQNPVNNIEPMGLSGIVDPYTAQDSLRGEMTNMLTWGDYVDRRMDPYRIKERVLGTVQAVAGVGQMVLGSALLDTPFALLGGWMIVKGLDNTQAGVRTAYSGKSVSNFTNQAAVWLASKVTDDPIAQNAIGIMVDLGTDFVPQKAFKTALSKFIKTPNKFIKSELSADEMANAMGRGDDLEGISISSGPGSEAHKTQRWADYQKRGGKYAYERWSKQYDVNMSNATHGLSREKLYRDVLEGENRIFNTLYGNRQIDSFVEEAGLMMQLKTGRESLTTTGRLSNVLAIQRDAWFVKRGFTVEWILEKGGSKPLLKALEDAGIKYHIGPILK